MCEGSMQMCSTEIITDLVFDLQVRLMCLLGYISVCLSRRSMCEEKKKRMSRE